MNLSIEETALTTAHSFLTVQENRLKAASFVSVRTLIRPMIHADDFGACGDSSDQTDALNAALMAARGRTLYIPAGTYLIDGNHILGKSLRPHSNTHIILDPDVRLLLKVDPSCIAGTWQTPILLLLRNIEHVTIEGNGAIFDGNRAAWLAAGAGVEGDPAQLKALSHTIDIGNSHHLQLSNLRLVEHWGDGIMISNPRPYFGETAAPSDVTLTHLNVDHAARNGMSISAGRRIRVTECQFTHTAGLPPGNGVDIETEASNEPVIDVNLVDCAFEDNETTGLMLWTQQADIRGIHIERCSARRNRGTTANRGYGVAVCETADHHILDTALISLVATQNGVGVTVGGQRLVMSDALIHQNDADGLIIRAGSQYINIHRGHISANQRGLFCQENIQHLALSDIVLSDNRSDGAQINRAQDMMINGLTIHNNGGTGLLLVHTQRTMMRQCRLSNNGQTGDNTANNLYLEGNMDLVIDTNLLIPASVSPRTAHNVFGVSNGGWGIHNVLYPGWGMANAVWGGLTEINTLNAL